MQPSSGSSPGTVVDILQMEALGHSGFHVFPRRVSCFPCKGFMFSLVGFHVFPFGVSCFPSQGFMFSPLRTYRRKQISQLFSQVSCGYVFVQHSLERSSEQEESPRHTARTPKGPCHPRKGADHRILFRTDVILQPLLGFHVFPRRVSCFPFSNATIS